MNLVSRNDLQEAEGHYSGDDSAAVRCCRPLVTHKLEQKLTLLALGVQTRAKCWLFLSYVVAFASVAGSVAVLVQCAQASLHLYVGVVRACRLLVCSAKLLRLTMGHSQGGLLQTGLILASGLLLWAFRTQDDDGYAGYSNY